MRITLKGTKKGAVMAADLELYDAQNTGQMVIDLRRKHALSQSELAKRAGISQSTVSRIERNAFANGTNLQHLIDIARGMNTKLRLYFFQKPLVLG